MSLQNPQFAKVLRELIRFKASTTIIPIKAENWEELIWATLVFMFGEEKVIWNPQSHEKSVDIKAKIDGDFLKISAKAGKITKAFLTISSYRLTTFDTLKDQLSFIKKQHDNFDFYLICAREINKAKDYIDYCVIKIDSKRLAPNWLLAEDNWQQVKTGYELKQNFDFDAKIVFKMSNQLWYKIPIKYFSAQEIMVKVRIPFEYLGKGLVWFLEKKVKK